MSETRDIRDLLDRAGPVRFAYNHDAQKFLIGERQVSLEAAVANPTQLVPFHDDQPTDADPMLTSVLWHHVMYPGMYDWLDQHFTRDVSQETVEVMIDVFAALTPDMPRQRLRPDSGGFMGFSAERYRREHPHLTLQVLGNCACMGVKVDGMLGQREWSAKFASFEMHNVDTPAQRVSIQAGLGHLAYRAEQES